VAECQPTSGRLDKLAVVIFYLSAAVIGAQYVVFTELRYWLWDFWHHAAFIRQLQNAPWSLGNPFFEGPDIYTLYWPYEYLISGLANLTGATPHLTLALFGFINLSSLILLLKKFSNLLNQSPLMPAFSLLLILLFWPGDPLIFSSFYSLYTLFFIAAYPGTFALVLTLGAILVLKNNLFRNHQRYIIPVVATLVALIHPITFIFFAVTLSALWLEKKARLVSLIPASILIALAVAFFWPFFPLSELIFSKTFSADSNGAAVYRDFLSRYWPTFIAIPIIAQRLWNDKRDFWGISFLALYLLYWVGYLVEVWNLGRSIAFVMLISQILIADWIIRFFISLKTKYDLRLALIYPTAMLVILFSMLLTLAGVWINQTIKNPPTLYQDAQALSSLMEPGATVIADSEISQTLPSFGLKIIAFNTPPFFRGTYEERVADIDTFFNAITSPEERAQIIKKYGARYLVKDVAKNPAALLTGLPSERLYSNSRYELLRLY